MNIYRNKENKKLYTIEHLILDIYHLNHNEFAGLYAYPYKWEGETIVFQSKDHAKCKNFTEQLFDIVANF
jgi:hypothetical protein